MEKIVESWLRGLPFFPIYLNATAKKETNYFFILSITQ